MTLDRGRKVIITGSAGFIGYHLSSYLLKEGFEVVGFDNFNDYYDVSLKESRNKDLELHGRYRVIRGDLVGSHEFYDLIMAEDVSAVFHLAAQAGVRYSLEKPEIYLHSNVDAMLHVLEVIRKKKEKQNISIPLLAASSSSVYGLSNEIPFKETDRCDRQVSLYGVTKRANELMAHSYAHLFGLDIVMLRFFTVYGPWGRPDMALYQFVKSILDGEKVKLYNHGDMIRDFTYVSDIVDGIWKLVQLQWKGVVKGCEIFNIGCGHPRPLKDYVKAIERALGKTAETELLPFQPGDVYKTYADVSKLSSVAGYKPQVEIEEGVQEFVRWYLSYYGKNIDES